MWIGMGRHLNCGGDFGAERRCFGELSKEIKGKGPIDGVVFSRKNDGFGKIARCRASMWRGSGIGVLPRKVSVITDVIVYFMVVSAMADTND